MGKSKELATLIKVALLSMVLLFVYFALRPDSQHRHNDPEIERYHNAFHIGNALLHYREDHSGKLPDYLSELVPRYINSSNIAWFFWPPTREFVTNLDQISEPLANKIDNEGTFIYLGVRGFQENLVLYVRPDFWPKDPDANSVATLTTNNFTAKLRPVKDVRDRLSRLPKLSR